MTNVKNLLSLLNEALGGDVNPMGNADISVGTRASSSNSMIDISGVQKGSIVTVDFTQDDPKTFEVIEVDDKNQCLVILDKENKKTYKVPLSKIAIQDDDTPYTEDELDKRYGLDKEGHTEEETAEDKVDNEKTGAPTLASMKTRGVKLSILKQSLDKMKLNRGKVVPLTKTDDKGKTTKSKKSGKAMDTDKPGVTPPVPKKTKPSEK